MAFAVTGGGGLALLAGVLLIGNIAGTFELSAWFSAREAIRSHPHFNVALALILLGAFTKSAQFPFHFWLPAAMAAPTPASAYLHSATMVKAGVFLLARLYPLLGGNVVFEYVTTTVGLTTFVFGAYVAMFRHDLKGLLAYSTISHLGLIMFLLGLDTPMSSVAAIFHIGNHALGAAVGIGACLLFTTWATLTSVKLPALNRVLLDLGPLNYQLHPFLIGVFNHVILFGVGLIASLLLKSRRSNNC